MKNCWQQNSCKKCGFPRCIFCKNIDWYICENPNCDSQNEDYHATSATEFISTPTQGSYGLFWQRTFQGYISADDEHVIILPPDVVLPDDTQFPPLYIEIKSTLFYKAKTYALTAEDFKIEKDRVTLIMPFPVVNGYYYFTLIWDLKHPF